MKKCGRQFKTYAKTDKTAFIVKWKAYFVTKATLLKNQQ